jgi:hypothetical protein
MRYRIERLIEREPKGCEIRLKTVIPRDANNISVGLHNSGTNHLSRCIPNPSKEHCGVFLRATLQNQLNITESEAESVLWKSCDQGAMDQFWGCERLIAWFRRGEEKRARILSVAFNSREKARHRK